MGHVLWVEVSDPRRHVREPREALGMADGSSTRDNSDPDEWAHTYRLLVEAPRAGVAVADLEALAEAAYLIGDDDASQDAWESAYHRYLEAGERADAARCAFWLALTLMLHGNMARAGGWLSRTQSAIGDDLECPASGYLLIPATLGAIDAGEPAKAVEMAIQARDVGARFSDRDLSALGILCHGQALIAYGDCGSGLAKLDEVMLSVVAGDVGPITSGIVYCAVILECMQMFDLARASEWTDALDAWCRAQPELVPFRGQCLVHQSQVRQAAGQWREAVATVELACERLTDPPHPALGLALYQEAELHRLTGAENAAADAYARASRAGHEPMPGLALLDLARGDVRAASASIKRALREARQASRRTPLLAAGVEILRAADDREGARAAALELGEIASGSTSEVLQAMANDAAGAVLFDDGDMPAALGELRAAAGTWRRLKMPYDAARTGVLIGLACAALGDASTASLEFANARETFASLGAEPDLARLQPLADGLTAQGRPPAATAGLSARELEVLSYVAAGMTSPEIAEALMISRHTVRRHLQNVYVKLGVNSRAAATAYAYEHDLL